MNLIKITNKKTGSTRTINHKGTPHQGIDRITGYLQGLHDAGGDTSDYEIEHQYVSQNGRTFDWTHRGEFNRRHSIITEEDN